MNIKLDTTNKKIILESGQTFKLEELVLELVGLGIDDWSINVDFPLVYTYNNTSQYSTGCICNQKD